MSPDTRLTRGSLLKDLRTGTKTTSSSLSFATPRTGSSPATSTSSRRGTGFQVTPELATKAYPGMLFAEFVNVVSETPDEEANIHFRSQSSVLRGRGEHACVMASQASGASRT